MVSTERNITNDKPSKIPYEQGTSRNEVSTRNTANGEQVSIVEKVSCLGSQHPSLVLLNAKLCHDQDMSKNCWNSSRSPF